MCGEVCARSPKSVALHARMRIFSRGVWRRCAARCALSVRNVWVHQRHTSTPVTMSPGINSCDVLALARGASCYVELTIGAECLGASASRINSSDHVTWHQLLRRPRARPRRKLLRGARRDHMHRVAHREGTIKCPPRPHIPAPGGPPPYAPHQREPAQVQLSFGGVGRTAGRTSRRIHSRP